MPNNPDKLFLLKGQVRNDLRSVKYNSDRHLYEVVFSNGKLFHYRPEDVWELFRDEDIPMPVRVIRMSDYMIFSHVIGVTTFVRSRSNKGQPDAYRVVFEDGKSYYYPAKDIMLDRKLSGERPKTVFQYLRSLANFSRIEIDDDTTIGLFMKYKKVDAVYESSPLSKYLVKDDEKLGPVSMGRGIDANRPIFPFGCNRSQYQAVKNALSNKISVIQGPPGTGKTQTILNIVANLLISEKNVQIVSNNNSAVQNVADKLSNPKYHLEWLMAYLGRSEKKNAFYSSQSGSYPDISTWEWDGLNDLRKEITTLSEELLDGYDLQENMALYRAQLKEAEAQLAQEGHSLIHPKAYRKFKTSSEIAALIAKLGITEESGKKLPLALRIKLRLWHLNPSEREPLERAFYQKVVDTLTSKLTNAEQKIASIQDKEYDLQRKSLYYLRGILYKRYKGGERRTFQWYEVEKLNPQPFLKEYPIVLSTTFSATSNINPAVPFDYLIMDEASQIDVSAGALAMNCSRNAVIVGDTKQLPNVVDNDTKIAADMLWKNFSLPKAYDFVGQSFLSSICELYPSVPTTLLREHYRCAPAIIGFCNKQFYGGQLVAMTKEDAKEPSVKLCKTTTGNFARGTCNVRQAEMIVQELIPELQKTYNDIGIIAPYNDQVREIKRQLGNSAIPVATVHKFQGRENDVVILSTVANQITPFIDDPHLLNVAVSRAKKLFVLVVSDGEQPDSNIKDLIDYIRVQNGDVFTTSLHSVFDLLYKELEVLRRSYLSKHRQISSVDSENLLYALLEDILKQPEFSKYEILCHYPLRCLITEDSPLNEQERTFATRSWTHLDFLIYNSITKMPALAIEVDGANYHFEGSAQRDRDLLKDSVLQKIGLKVVRLSTTGSNEREKIERELRG